MKFGEASAPVVAETFDGRLNDIGGFHVRAEHALAALEAAKSDAVDEGNVGGGTGMVCFEFKRGIGTASRQVAVGEAHDTVGVLVPCNTGDRSILRIAGAPVGQELAGRWLLCYVPNLAPSGKQPLCAGDAKAGKAPGDSGSILIVVGTDAPLISTQLNRVAKRAALGLGRFGSYSGNLYFNGDAGTRTAWRRENFRSAGLVPDPNAGTCTIEILIHTHTLK